MSGSDKFKCRWCSCVFTRAAPKNNYVELECPYCTIDHLTTMLDKMCAELKEAIKNEIREPHPSMGEQVSED